MEEGRVSILVGGIQLPVGYMRADMGVTERKAMRLDVAADTVVVFILEKYIVVLELDITVWKTPVEGEDEE